MHPVIKIIFCIPLIVNGLVTAFYFVMTLDSLVNPPGPSYTRQEGVSFLLITMTVLGLLGWAYYLAMIREKAGAGFGVLVLSYLAWPILLLILFLFTDIKNWH
ncbi:hypothetical protein [Spirosoma fluminis]